MSSVLVGLGTWFALSIPAALLFCAIAYFGGASRRPTPRHPAAESVKEKEDTHHV